jgi:dienelactone hydrolase
MVSDIFGATSGYHEAVADTYASLGYNVYLPELLSDPYTGEMDIGKIMANIKGQNVKLM